MLIEMKITMDDAGQFNVTGPLENEFLARGMIDKARNTLDNFYAKQASQSKIIKATQIPPLVSMNGGRKDS